MRRVAVGVTALALVSAGAASAHNPGVGIPTGYVATVSGIQPNIVGVRATTVLGDQIAVSNLSRRPVVILDRNGRPFMRITNGRTKTWHDARVIETGPPPPPRPGAAATEPRFVKNWTIPGRAGARSFAINGFLGWVPPTDSGGGGMPLAVWVGGAAFLLALSVAAAWLLGRRRPA